MGSPPTAMTCIQEGSKLPPFPFQVVCVDNEGREEEITLNKVYTVIRDLGSENPGLASADFVLQGVNGSFHIRRFRIVSSSDNMSDWRIWRDCGLEPGHCVCRIPKELCKYHKD
jgi:hypothetical protein